MVERSLPTQEIRVSNPVFGNFIYYQLYWKVENKEKEAGNEPNNNSTYVDMTFVHLLVGLNSFDAVRKPFLVFVLEYQSKKTDPFFHNCVVD